MKKELNYFYIGDSLGGNQEWFSGFMMKKGGCGAETACDISVYLAKSFNMTNLYPYSLDPVRKEEYVAFADKMRPYLSPRPMGINRLDLYMDGIEKYFRDAGSPELVTEPIDGNLSWQEAGKRLCSSIDAGYPVPCLILKHKNPEMEDYVWHWFLLIGYETIPDASGVSGISGTSDASDGLDLSDIESESMADETGAGCEKERLLVKAVTYSEAQWLDFQKLWETGYREKGGLVLLKRKPENQK